MATGTTTRALCAGPFGTSAALGPLSGASAAARPRGRRLALWLGAGPRRRAPSPEAHRRRRDEHARVGAGDDPDDHREREPVQHLAAEEEQSQRREQRRCRAVMTVRPSVWLIEALMTWPIESRRIDRRFSRIRSKITMVSLVE